MSHAPEFSPTRRYGGMWIAFLLGVIVMWFAIGVVPYWRLILQMWQGCMA